MPKTKMKKQVPIEEGAIVWTKLCRKCGKPGVYGYKNTRLNDFHFFRKDKRGQGKHAYENICKTCRRGQMYAATEIREKRKEDEGMPCKS